MKTIYVALLALLHVCFSVRAAGTVTTTNQTPKPIVLLDKLSKSIDKPVFTNWLSRHRHEIFAWQAETERQGTNRPVGMHRVTQYVTTSVLEQALGKPQRVNTEELPGFIDLTGGTARLRVLWYGPVGFAFAMNQPGKVQGILTLHYRPK